MLGYTRLAAWFVRSSWSRRILTLHLGLFVVLGLVDWVVSLLQPQLWGSIDRWLTCYPEWHHLAHQPWSVLTYIIPHSHLLHLLVNLLALYFILPRLESLVGGRRLITLYLLGALSGSLSYVLVYTFGTITGMYTLLPLGLQGASAAVCFSLILVLGLSRRSRVGKRGSLPFSTGQIFALAIPLLLALGQGVSNLGGLIAHLGAMLLALLLLVLCPEKLRPGVILSYIETPRRTPSDSPVTEELRHKLRHSGYSSLTPNERKYLQQGTSTAKPTSSPHDE